MARDRMGDQQSKAEEYRRMAASCLEVAERMSLKSDRAQLVGTAQHWLELARKAEAEGW